MRMSPATYAIGSTIVILLLTSCGGSTTLSMPTASEASQSRTIKHLTSSCPCLYVADLNAPQGGAVTVYPSSANGNVKPIQQIAGYNTGIFDPRGVAVDGTGKIYVVEEGGGGPGTINVYAPGATGNVAPIQSITGSNTLMEGSDGIAINPVNGDIYVTNEPIPPSGNGSILIFPNNANGNVAPSGIIAGSNTGLYNNLAVALDGSGNIYATNYISSASRNSITVYAAGSTGNVSPMRTIKGGLTKLTGPEGLALDSNSNVYVANFPRSVTVYASGANGNVAPIQLIKGSATKLKYTSGVAVDSSSNIYASNGAGYGGVSRSFVTVYASGANGNVPYIQRIKGTKTGLGGPDGITIH
ncbi:MAG: hypothetical protein WB810_17685 [Candidatus Cybelea sp.]